MPELDDAGSIFPSDPVDPSAEPTGDPVAPAPEPAGPSADAETAGALREVLGAVNALNQRIAALEGRAPAGAQPAPAQPAADPADPSAMYANPTAFIDQRVQAGTKAALDQFAGQLTPFFETVAENLAQRGIDTARSQFDSTIGQGAFDKLVANDLEIALSKLPPAQRANASYVQAIAAGVLGGKMLTPEGQQEVRTVMAAARQRPNAPVVLTGNGGRPAPDRLTEGDRDLIDRVRRSGIPVDEKAFLANRSRPRTEDAWGATWMNPPAPQRPNGAAK